MYIHEYMTREVVTISPDSQITEAMNIMQQHKIRRLPVVKGRSLVGLITRDSLRNLGVRDVMGANYRYYMVSKAKVSEIMVKNVITVTPDMTIEEGATLGQQHNIGVLPVIDKGKLVGIITITDLYKIFTQVLGFNKPGVRLHIIGCLREDGNMKDISSVVCRQGSLIQSMFCLEVPEGGRNDLIIHLNTDNPNNIVSDLRAKGFTVEVRAH